MKLPFFQIDAFEEGPFSGNPAAVCVLTTPLEEAVMQAVAAENNLSETAFISPREHDWLIRWFTPACEVDLCGHATLASGAVVLERMDTSARVVQFHSPRSGPLAVHRRDGRLELDFPVWPAEPMPVGPLAAALRAAPSAAFSGHYWMAVFAAEADVAGLAPDMARIAELPVEGVIATAPGRGTDFVSRFFGPRVGVPEDPVTGSAHAMLAPYWATRLGRPSLQARQISARGGRLWCEARGERVGIAGRARFVIEGEFTL